MSCVALGSSSTSVAQHISLITYATKLEIDLCNFLAIWAVLSILLYNKSNELQYVKTLQ